MNRDLPTRAELDADENSPSILAGRVRCPAGCRAWFVSLDTPAYQWHAATFHGDTP